jgi:thiol-disulfide isomerase/thioredoxin
MTSGAVVLLVAIVVAIGFGVFRALTDGRFRGTHRVRGAEDQRRSATDEPASVLAGTPWVDDAGERFTLLQFSSAFCAPCRAARRVLGDVAADRADVAHIEVDAEHHLDLVRRLGVLRTPTTLILDGSGREIGRASGVPTRSRVEEVLGG